MHRSTLHLLEAKPPPPPPGAEAAADAAREELAEHPLRCAACGHPVTRESERIAVDGRHAHTRFNPAGVVFHFGLFARAPGARVEGAPTREATWFSGLAWAYAHCGRCGVHLGWHFRGAQDFFALVLARLAAS